MNGNYIFMFFLNGEAVFSRNGEYFINKLVDETNISIGLFTNDPEGFYPVGSIDFYNQIVRLKEVNDKLQKIAILEAGKDITVAVHCDGAYEYFRLAEFKPEDITDSLSEKLVAELDSPGASSFAEPYKIKGCKAEKQEDEK